jgi:hypothetical protein
MAFKQLDKKSKTKKILNIIGIILIVIMSLLLVYALYNRFWKPKDINSSADNLQQSTEKIMKNGEVSIFTAKSDLKPGTILGPDNLVMVMRPENETPENAIKSLTDIKGKRLKTRRSANEVVLLTDLISDESWFMGEDRYTEHKFMPESIPAIVQVGSLVDIKLFINGGEDPIVISKAVVESRTGDVLGFYLNFEEQEYLKEAASQGLLFLTVYADSNQPASVVTYKTQYELKNKDISNNELSSGTDNSQ